MHIHLSPRHLVLTGAINSYVVNKLAHLDNQSDQIIAADLYAAIDLVMDKLSRQLRKRKTRLVTSKKHKTQLAAERRKRGV